MVDRDGLENRCTLTGTQGSNPCLSADKELQARGLWLFVVWGMHGAIWGMPGASAGAGDKGGCLLVLAGFRGIDPIKV